MKILLVLLSALLLSVSTIAKETLQQEVVRLRAENKALKAKLGMNPLSKNAILSINAEKKILRDREIKLKHYEYLLRTKYAFNTRTKRAKKRSIIKEIKKLRTGIAANKANIKYFQTKGQTKNVPGF